jgi:septal ring factor EnvC (AmiA/AmiB activator)
MSKEFNDIIREINKQNKELHSIDNSISKEVVKEISDLKKSVKNIENKIRSMDDTLIKLFDILNTITVFIEDAESMNGDDLDDEEDWTPYDERNFSYNNDEDDDDEEESEWNIHEDES